MSHASNELQMQETLVSPTRIVDKLDTLVDKKNSDQINDLKRPKNIRTTVMTTRSNNASSVDKDSAENK